MTKLGFSFDAGSKAFDWNAYLRVRPQYPQSLYDMLFEHHQKYSDKWNHAYDMATGVGIVAERLAPRFKYVTASDPSTAHISLAPSFMSSHFKHTNVRFLQCRAEDVSQLDAKSFDMITMGEGMMYTDPSQTVASATYLLSSGGTFAAWIYDIIPRILSQPALEPDELQLRIYDLFDNFMCSVVEARGAEPMWKLYGHMTDLKFDESEWEHVRRFNWKRYRQFPPRAMEVIQKSPLLNCVRPWETVEEHEEACMIMRDVDWGFLNGYLDSLWPEGTMREMCPKEVAAVEALMQNGRRVDLAFTTSLVLATKK